MARYTGPRTRISRRFGIPMFGPDNTWSAATTALAFTDPSPAASTPNTAWG